MRPEIFNEEHIKKVRKLTRKEQEEKRRADALVAFLSKEFGGKEVKEYD